MNQYFLNRAVLWGAFLVVGLSAQAKPKPSKKLDDVGKVKVPVGDAANLVNRTRVGERYRLWLSFNPTDCNDPQYPGKSNPYDDHAFECYGQLTLNGKTYWKIDKKSGAASYAKVGHRDLPAPLEVNPRLQGYRLNRPWQTSGSKGEPFEFESYLASPKASIVHLSLKLYDLDNPIFYDDGPYNTPPDRNDDTFGDYKIDLDLLKMGEGHFYWFWQGEDESGNAVGSNLFLFVEHVGSIYDSSGKKPLEVGPVIEKPRLPGKIPGPGPLIKGRH